jgi:low temperature requirement protein LtrA
VETLVLLLVVWLGWIHTVWITNSFDIGARSLRLVLIGTMFASLIMSASLPQAFDDRGLAFAAGFVAVLVGGTAFLLVSVGRRHHLGDVFLRVLIWWSAVGALALAGGLASGDARLAIWVLALLLGYGVMWQGFVLPRLGRSLTTDYTIAGEHMANRCLLFVTLALGESILITGANFGDLASSAGRMAAFVVAFTGTVTFWWIYFDRAAEDAIRVIAEATDPGLLGLTAYTYFHIPMVAGVIAAAAADELGSRIRGTTSMRPRRPSSSVARVSTWPETRCGSGPCGRTYRRRASRESPRSSR